MFYIAHVDVEGFWGKFNASTDFLHDVNILIGKNGTGKTTFMDMLQAILRVDLSQLYSLEFDRITIKLKHANKQRTISVIKEKDAERPFDVITYKIGRQSYRLALHPRDIIERHRLLHNPGRFDERYLEVKQEIDKIVNIASLSVHRISYDELLDEEDVFRHPRKRSERPVVDRRLDQLSKELTTYQLSLAEKEKEVSALFQKNVLVSMLYDEQFDTLDLREAANTELLQEKQLLNQAYEELGVADEGKIDRHFVALNDGLSAVRRFLDESGKLEIKNIISLPLLKRTRHIIDLSLEAEKEKQEISHPIRQFLGIASEFMNDKVLSINPATGMLRVTKDGRSIPLLDLSSGEKQLLILLIETLLQENEFFIFLADEPEISLHIEWQEKIISSIRKLNSSSQIIVATHSPEIAGGWRPNLIDMEDIISG
jgi:ABC-type cobalamin/Fe3+-siderophores transport system ATPase subunit